MKYLIFVLALSLAIPALAYDSRRDLKKYPLSEKELKAYRASKSLAKVLGQRIHPRCVNAENPESQDSKYVTIQFYNSDEEANLACGDSHYSISVEFTKEGEIYTITFVDA